MEDLGHLVAALGPNVQPVLPVVLQGNINTPLIVSIHQYLCGGSNCLPLLVVIAIISKRSTMKLTLKVSSSTTSMIASTITTTVLILLLPYLDVVSNEGLHGHGVVDKADLVRGAGRNGSHY